jgi:hypothetical protein
MSARSSADVFELRCAIREQLIAFLQQEYPNALPHQRTETLYRQQDAADPASRERPPRTAAR